MKKRLFSYLLCISLLLGLPVSAATDSVTYTPSGTVTMIGVDTPLPVELRSVYDYESLGIASDYHTTTAANGSFSFDPITFTKEGEYVFEVFTPPVKRLAIVCNCGEWFWAEDPDFVTHNAMHGLAGENDGYSSVHKDNPDIRTDTRSWDLNVVVARKNGALAVTSATYERTDGTMANQATFLTVTAKVPESSADAVNRAKEVLASMTLDEKVAQCFLLPYSVKPTVTPGGYVLSRSDFSDGNPNFMARAINARQYEAKVPLLVAASELGGTLSPASGLSSYRSAPFGVPATLAGKGSSAVSSDARQKAAFLSSMGINLNIGPSADVSGSGYAKPRSFGSDGTAVSSFVAAAVSGQEGIATALLEFPGYGSLTGDTSNASVTNGITEETFRYSDSLPFHMGMAAGADAVLVGHSRYSNLTGNEPASLSASAYTRLRDDFHYDKVAMTDNLSKAAVSGTSHPATVALKAGADLVWTEDVSELTYAIQAAKKGTIPEARVNEAALRVLTLKAERGILDLEPEAPNQEATYQSFDGAVTETGSFSDMWTMLERTGNGTITLNANVSASESFVCAGEADKRTIDLNGFTLTGAQFQAPTGQTFTITDSNHSISEGSGSFSYTDPDGVTKQVNLTGVGQLAGGSVSVTGGNLILTGGVCSEAVTVDKGTITMTGGLSEGLTIRSDGTGVITNGYVAGAVRNQGTLTLGGTSVCTETVLSEGTLMLQGQAMIGKSVTSDGTLRVSGTPKLAELAVENTDTVLSGSGVFPLTLASGITMESSLSKDAQITVTTEDTADTVPVLRTEDGTGLRPADASYRVVSRNGAVFFTREEEGTLPVSVMVDGYKRSLDSVPVTRLGEVCRIAESDLTKRLGTYGYPERALAIRDGETVSAAGGTVIDGVYRFSLVGEVGERELTLRSDLFSVRIGDALSYVPAGEPFETVLSRPKTGYHWEGTGIGEDGVTVRVPSVSQALSYTEVEDAVIPEGSLRITHTVYGETDEAFSYLVETEHGRIEKRKADGTFLFVTGATILEDGDQLLVSGIPVGESYTVTVSGPDCETQILMDGTEVSEASGVVSGEEEVLLSFTHTLGGSTFPDTGSGSGRQILFVGITTVGIGLGFLLGEWLWKKRHK